MANTANAMVLIAITMICHCGGYFVLNETYGGDVMVPLSFDVSVCSVCCMMYHVMFPCCYRVDVCCVGLLFYVVFALASFPWLGQLPFTVEKTRNGTP